MVGGDPQDVISDAFVMQPEDSGLEYPALVRPAPSGKGYDVVRPL